MLCCVRGSKMWGGKTPFRAYLSNLLSSCIMHAGAGSGCSTVCDS